jgi:5'-phosphate synthase pdxT subunit
VKKLGVLALQGSVIEHINALSKIPRVEACEVRTLDELNSVDGIIIPGGESTTMGKLLRDFGLLEPLKKKIKEGMPVWGTCAGLILLANKISDDENVHLGVMDIRVRRNAYGGQLDSFVTEKVIPQIADNDLKLVFIRAPWVEEVGRDVEVLSEHDGKIIAVRQGNMMGTSFHPELTAGLEFHKYFANM